MSPTTSAVSHQRPSNGNERLRGEPVDRWIGLVFLSGCVLAGLRAPPIDWRSLLGFLLAICLAWSLRVRLPVLARILFSLGVMPIWVGAAAHLGWSGLVLGILSILLVVLGWSDVRHRRVALLLLALGVVEGGRTWLLGGLEQRDIALGLLAYAAVGSGVWSAARSPRVVGPGTIFVVLIVGVRVLWAYGEEDRVTVNERAHWGLGYARDLEEDPSAGLQLLGGEQQTYDLVVFLLEHYSVASLMEAGLEPRIDQLTTSEILTAARWLERSGRGGAALSLLQGVREDETICWWETLYSRTQQEPMPDCVYERPESVPILDGGGPSLEWPVAQSEMLQVELHVVGRGRGLSLSMDGNYGELRARFDHGEWIVASQEPGNSEWYFPSRLDAGPLRVQLVAPSRPDITSEIRLKLLPELREEVPANGELPD